ncbi:MAG: alpha/beta hydrolase-fold protein [Acidobacteria bacterium]|nr:alpha/beta hydrolase-fold protein [Acidobacteriota bacterium]
MKPVLTLLLMAASLTAADPAQELLAQAKKSPNSAEFKAALGKILRQGRGAAGYNGEFLFAAEAKTTPVLELDEAPGPKFTRLKGSDFWMARATLKTGTSHRYAITIDGQTNPPIDFPAFGPDSYENAAAPAGKLSDKIVHTSKVYPGMVTNYWVYVPAQYSAATAAALFVVQDGQGYANREGANRLLITLDNLTHQKRIPVAITVMISPGMIGERRMRSIQYDTVDDTYARFLREEIVKDVEAKYNIRKDAYSRAIMGESSGAICAFTVAWFDTERYSRVFSRIGTYTSIQWKPGQKDGGNIYPFWLRKSPRKNIRVWLQDSSNDLENDHGSWPLQNIQMANSLKMKEYDFKFTWGNGGHSTAQGNAQAPEALTWLWRGYDPAKTSETFVMDPAEKAKPYWRVKALNRE